MADQPKQNPADAAHGESPQKPADAGNADRGKISRVTEKAQEEAAKERAREGGYQ